MKRNSFVNSFLALSISVTLWSCNKDERPDLVIPDRYESPNFNANASVQLAVTNQLKSLTDEAKKARVNGTIITKATLDNLFTTGTTSLKSQCSVYYAGKLEGTGGYFDEIAKASGGTYTPSANISGNGGTYGGYLFDENGLEIEQLIEKGQFGAVLYKHLSELLGSNITETSIDQAMAIIGLNPTFPNSSDATKHPQPDKFLAVYAARRDKNDGNGFYSQLKRNFIKLKAAIQAGSEYNQERDEAVGEIKLLVEKINAATIINYCHSVIATMSNTNPTDAQKGSALHAYGECVGFIHGWRTLGNKKISDAQIDETLTLLNAPYNGVPTSYKFITNPVEELPKLTQVINKLRDIYGFTAQEIEDFKKNWVAEQNR
jgi:hypothetical protein